MRLFALVFVGMLLAGCTTTGRSDTTPINAKTQAFIQAQRAIDQRECADQHGTIGPAYRACIQDKTIDRQEMLQQMLDQFENRRADLAEQCYDPITGDTVICYDI